VDRCVQEIACLEGRKRGNEDQKAKNSTAKKEQALQI